MAAPPGYDINTNSFITLRPLAKAVVENVLKGNYICGCVFGPPGIGKNYLVRESYAHQKAQKDFHYLNLEAMDTDAPHMVDLLYRYKESNNVIWFDDKASLFLSQSMVEHFLVVTAMDGEKRMVIDVTKGGYGKFEFKGRVLVTQNDDIFGPNYNIPTHLQARMNALKDRLMYAKCTFPELKKIAAGQPLTRDPVAEEIYHYISYIAISSFMFRKNGLDAVAANQVLDFWHRNFGFFERLSIRMLEAIIKARALHPAPIYQQQWAQYVQPTIQRIGQVGVWTVGNLPHLAIPIPPVVQPITVLPTPAGGGNATPGQSTP